MRIPYMPFLDESSIPPSADGPLPLEIGSQRREDVTVRSAAVCGVLVGLLFTASAASAQTLNGCSRPDEQLSNTPVSGSQLVGVMAGLNGTTVRHDRLFVFFEPFDPTSGSDLCIELHSDDLRYSGRMTCSAPAQA